MHTIFDERFIHIIQDVASVHKRIIHCIYVGFTSFANPSLMKKTTNNTQVHVRDCIDYIHFSLEGKTCVRYMKLRLRVKLEHCMTR